MENIEVLNKNITIKQKRDNQLIVIIDFKSIEKLKKVIGNPIDLNKEKKKSSNKQNSNQNLSVR